MNLNLNPYILLTILPNKLFPWLSCFTPFQRYRNGRGFAGEKFSSLHHAVMHAFKNVVAELRRDGILFCKMRKVLGVDGTGDGDESDTEIESKNCIYGMEKTLEKSSIQNYLFFCPFLF